jgi:hypothetical protein
MVLHGYVKQCKYKTYTSIWFYMVVLNSVNVKQCKFFWGEGGFHNVFGDRPIKWSIAPKKKNNQNIHSQLIYIDLQEHMVIKGV